MRRNLSDRDADDGGSSGHSQPALYMGVFGMPEVRVGNERIHFRTKKALALLVYLAVTGVPQPRETLAALFWPDREASRARSTLRSTLRLLRQSLSDAIVAARVNNPHQEGGSQRDVIARAVEQVEQLVHSGRDRLGRECLWLERYHAPSGTAPGIPDAADIRHLDKDINGTIHFDHDVLEQGATLAARLPVERSPEHGGLTDAAARDEVIQRLSLAVAACRGMFLQDFSLEDSDGFTDWLEQQRVYWQGQMDRVFDALCVLHLERGTFADATQTARRWLELNELHEPAYRRLMEAQAASGDRAAALATYNRCRNTLARVLDLEPSPETTALAERLRMSAVSADDVSFPSPLISARDEMPLPDGPGSPRDFADEKAMTTASWMPLAGRADEFSQLVGIYERVRRGAATASRNMQVVVLQGEAGIGKTRLAEEFLRWAAETRGAEVLRGRAFEAGGRIPYQALVEALRARLEREHAPEDLLDDVWLVELTRILPELRERYPDLPAPSGEDNAAQTRLFEAVTQLGLALLRRAGAASLVLFLDDVQWTDVGTRDIVRFLIRRWRETDAPALVVLAVRSEEVSTRGDLREWLRELAREVDDTGNTVLPLGALDADTVHALLDNLITEVSGPGADATSMSSARIHQAPPTTRVQANKEITAQLARWLYAETSGQPLYLVQTLRMLFEQGTLTWAELERPSALASDRWQPRLRVRALDISRLGRLLPASMRAVIQQRLDRLSAPTYQFLMAGAVLGTRFQPAQAWTVAHLDEAAGLDALEDAERHLVVHTGSGGETCVFTHDKLREVVYTETGEVRRRILHRRAYEMLEQSERAVPPAELMQHALLAGLSVPAFRAGVAAGDAALAVFAVRDAMGYYEQASRLLDEAQHTPVAGIETAALDAFPRAEREQLYLQLGRTYEWVGAWEKAQMAYTTLRAYAQEIGSRTLEGMALSRLAVVAREQSWDLYTAQALATEAVRVVESTGDVGVIAETHWALGQIATLANDMDVARPHAQRALELARAANSRILIARSLLLVAQTAQVWGEWDDIVSAAEEGRTRFREVADEVENTEAPHRKPQAESPGKTERASVAERHEHAKPPQLLWAGSPPATASGYRTLEAHCLSTACCGKICRGEPEEGVTDGRTALQMARTVNNAQMYAMGSYIIVPGLIEIGAYQEALDVTRQGLEDARVNSDAFSLMATRLALGHAMHALYQPEEAYAPLHEAAALAERIPSPHWHFRPWALLCVNRALAGDWPAAAEAAARAISLRDAAQVRLVYYDFSRHYEIEALLRAGNVARARVDVRRMSERVRTEWQDQRYHLILLRMRAVLARFDSQIPQAIALLEEALRLAEHIRLLGEQCQILAELAYLVHLDSERLAEAEAMRMRANTLATALAESVTDAQLRAQFLHATQDAYFARVRSSD